MAQVIRIGHSPDADDAFMFYALTHGKVTIPGVRIEHVLEDIESLNRRAATGELDVTAVSCATYPAIADRYRIMDPGASMGKGYGPSSWPGEPIPPRAWPTLDRHPRATGPRPTCCSASPWGTRPSSWWPSTTSPGWSWTARPTPGS